MGNRPNGHSQFSISSELPIGEERSTTREETLVDCKRMTVEMGSISEQDKIFDEIKI